ncbi:MAG: hypothetical protein LBN33_04615 [Desulfovibrio sp.]|jgi:hypothetical protein|nr:hypothetical protein [Desulfovibrio sp.]
MLRARIARRGQEGQTAAGARFNQHREKVKQIQEMPVAQVTPSAPLDKKAAEDVARGFGEMTNRNDGRVATLPVNTVGKILRNKGYDVSTIMADIPDLYEGSIHGWTEKLTHTKGSAAHSSLAGFQHYINKFSVGADEYFIRFAVQETKGGDNQVHSTIISEVAIYQNKNGGREQIGIINPLSPDTPHLPKGAIPQSLRVIDPLIRDSAPFVDKKLQDFFDGVNPDVALNQTKDGSPRGSVTFSGAQRIIEMFRNADLSTPYHESSHVFIQDLIDVVRDNGQTAAAKYAADLQALDCQGR